MNDLQTVFEISRTTESIDIAPFVIGFISLVIGVWGIHLKDKGKCPSWISHPEIFAFAGLVFIAFGCFSLFSWIGKSDRLLSAYKNGRYQVVEGRVSVLHMQPFGGHTKGDIITINGKQFEIDYFKKTPAYKKTISHGGVLREGVYAKIYYCSNDIVRIDTKRTNRRAPRSDGDKDNAF